MFFVHLRLLLSFSQWCFVSRIKHSVLCHWPVFHFLPTVISRGMILFDVVCVRRLLLFLSNLLSRRLTELSSLKYIDSCPANEVILLLLLYLLFEVLLSLLEARVNRTTWKDTWVEPLRHLHVNQVSIAFFLSLLKSLFVLYFLSPEQTWCLMSHSRGTNKHYTLFLGPVFPVLVCWRRGDFLLDTEINMYICKMHILYMWVNSVNIGLDIEV